MLPNTSPNANEALLDAVVDGLRLSSVFNFEPILSLPNISLVKAHPLFKLLRIFAFGQSFSQYQAALTECEPELAKHSEFPLMPDQSRCWSFSEDLDKNALEKKIRLVTLTSLASKRIGKDISYAEIAQELQVPEAEVENWVIQGPWSDSYIYQC